MKAWQGWIVAAMLPWSALATAVEPPEASAATLQAAVGGHRLIVLGELHGTREVPALAGALAQRYTAAGEPVVIALELPRDGNAAVRRYLATDGSAQARRQLLAERFLRPPAPAHDGRRNQAVVELIEQVRVLRRHGRDVAVVLIDVEQSRGDAAWRDRRMARTLRAVAAALPRGRVIAVVGNVHAMRVRPEGPRWPKALQTPMAAHLADLMPYTVEVTARQGAFWACASAGRCGVQAIPASAARSRPLDDHQPWHYRLVLPQLTPAAVLR